MSMACSSRSQHASCVLIHNFLCKKSTKISVSQNQSPSTTVTANTLSFTPLQSLFRSSLATTSTLHVSTQFGSPSFSFRTPPPFSFRSPPSSFQLRLLAVLQLLAVLLVVLLAVLQSLPSSSFAVPPSHAGFHAVSLALSAVTRAIPVSRIFFFFFFVILFLFFFSISFFLAFSSSSAFEDPIRINTHLKLTLTYRH
jgi:hypothetical protein